MQILADSYSIPWVGRLIFTVIVAADLLHRLFWLRPRYDEFVAKYGNNPEYLSILLFYWGPWYGYAMSSREAWRSSIIISSTGEVIAIIMLLLSLFLF